MRFDFDALELLIDGSVAQVLGVHWKQVSRWREIGVTVDQADELAVRAGFHPAEVWPEWVAMRACGARGCDATFVPYRSSQKWCSRACQRREHKRRRYQNDEAYAAAERERRRNFYKQVADYERAQARRRYVKNKTNLVQKIVGDDYKNNPANPQVTGYAAVDSCPLERAAVSRTRGSMDRMENVA